MFTQGFYDPVNEKMFEPSLTGFSYSFTDDGHFEEAYYRAISNRTDQISETTVEAISNKFISQLRIQHVLKALYNGSTESIRRTPMAPSV